MTRTLVAVLASTHPGPTVLVTAVNVALGAAAGLDPARLALLGGAMLFNQVSVGLSNDWLDAERDRRAGRSDKPLARGDVPLAIARAIAFAAIAVSLALTLPLGPLATLAQAVGIAAGWSYNLGLKATPASLLAYLVGFGVMPAIATLARPEPAWPALWVVGVAALLGAAAHFANAAPDLEEDAREGIRGLPHRIGRRASIAATWLALLAAAGLLVLGLGAAPASLGAAGLVLALAVLGVATPLGRGTTRSPFRLIMAAALVVAVALVAATTSIHP